MTHICYLYPIADPKLLPEGFKGPAFDVVAASDLTPRQVAARRWRYARVEIALPQDAEGMSHTIRLKPFRRSNRRRLVETAEHQAEEWREANGQPEAEVWVLLATDRGAQSDLFLFPSIEAALGMRPREGGLLVDIQHKGVDISPSKW